MYTMQKAVNAVRVLLRDPSQEELYFEDVRERLNALLRGYVQDMDLAGRDHRTLIEAVDVAEADIDYTLSLPNVPDFEAVKLEYASTENTANGTYWYEAKLIPFAAWTPNYTSDRAVACIYGSSALTEGQKLKLSFSPLNYQFRLSYRLPLLAEVQLGEKPPLPENLMPMLEYEGALDCIDIVKRDSKEWTDWVARVTPKYLRRAERERERWLAYLDASVEDPVQPVTPSDQFRHRGFVRMPRAYLPRG